MALLRRLCVQQARRAPKCTQVYPSSRPSVDWSSRHMMCTLPSMTLNLEKASVSDRQHRIYVLGHLLNERLSPIWQATTAQSYSTAASILERGAATAADTAESGSPQAENVALAPGVSALVAFMNQPEELAKKGGVLAAGGADGDDAGPSGAGGAAESAAEGNGRAGGGGVRMAPEGAVKSRSAERLWASRMTDVLVRRSCVCINRSRLSRRLRRKIKERSPHGAVCPRPLSIVPLPRAQVRRADPPHVVTF